MKYGYKGIARKAGAGNYDRKTDMEGKLRCNEKKDRSNREGSSVKFEPKNLPSLAKATGGEGK